MLVSISFISDLPLYKEEKPYTLHGQVAEGRKRSNCHFTVHDRIEVSDVREREDSFTLLQHGFQFTRHFFSVLISTSDFQAENLGTGIVKNYLDEVIALVKAETNASKVVLFDWRIRTSAPQAHAVEDDQVSDRSEFLAPASIAHSDYSYDGGLARFKRQLSSDEIKEYNLDDWHIRIINVWRPLVDKVYDAPLAFCDRRSVSQEDLLEEDKVHPTHWEEGLYLLHRDHHKWYWLSEQTRDEVAMFLTWDSAEIDSSVIPVCPPHASFRDESASRKGPPRESVEVRLLAFTKR
ncbi:hypothetical protein K469DRAFT_370108 [Zopfia rhizophila CBS 207.26]|uniref:Methyltransferase n=1 Tax=Zopfia rhizophila CBS 207.26 TaxID=1314779 RepID=A0A6A6EN60_9PEZI|nr:hypothetical protein K469DRAFT_370108 [Zopfia rhizophila CBS 207.26]